MISSRGTVCVASDLGEAFGDGAVVGIAEDSADLAEAGASAAEKADDFTVLVVEQRHEVARHYVADHFGLGPLHHDIVGELDKRGLDLRPLPVGVALEVFASECPAI